MLTEVNTVWLKTERNVGNNLKKRSEPIKWRLSLRMNTIKLMFMTEKNGLAPTAESLQCLASKLRVLRCKNCIIRNLLLKIRIGLWSICMPTRAFPPLLPNEERVFFGSLTTVWKERSR